MEKTVTTTGAIKALVQRVRFLGIAVLEAHRKLLKLLEIESRFWLTIITAHQLRWLTLGSVAEVALAILAHQVGLQR